MNVVEAKKVRNLKLQKQWIYARARSHFILWHDSIVPVHPSSTPWRVATFVQ